MNNNSQSFALLREIQSTFAWLFPFHYDVNSGGHLHGYIYILNYRGGFTVCPFCKDVGYLLESTDPVDYVKEYCERNEKKRDLRDFLNFT